MSNNGTNRIIVGEITKAKPKGKALKAALSKMLRMPQLPKKK